MWVIGRAYFDYFDMCDGTAGGAKVVAGPEEGAEGVGELPAGPADLQVINKQCDIMWRLSRSMCHS